MGVGGGRKEDRPSGRPRPLKPSLLTGPEAYAMMFPQTFTCHRGCEGGTLAATHGSAPSTLVRRLVGTAGAGSAWLSRSAMPLAGAQLVLALATLRQRNDSRRVLQDAPADGLVVAPKMSISERHIAVEDYRPGSAAPAEACDE